jgi:hypothetical protein
MKAAAQVARSPRFKEMFMFVIYASFYRKYVILPVVW